MRIGIVCRSPVHASSRVRALQYVGPLGDLGHEVEVLTWQPSSGRQVATLTGRLLALGRRCDVVLLVKPRLHPLAIRALARVNPRMVVDVDDAVWTWPAPFPRRFEDAATHAAVLTAGSEFLGRRLRSQYPSTRVCVVPTAVDTGHYVPAPRPRDGSVTIGWIGGPASLSDFGEPVLHALRGLTAAGRARLRVVCSQPLDHELLDADFEAWSAEAELSQLQGFDIGIMPLADDERSWGRCGLKALQYMAVGLPVVASPVGAANDIIEHDASGLLAETSAQWAEALGALVESPALRSRLGAAARNRTAERYSITSTLPTLLSVFDGLQRPEA